MFGRWPARRVLRQRGAGGLVWDARTRVDSAGDLALVPRFRRGGVPEWLKGADCKSAGVRLRWFESNPLHHHSLFSAVLRTMSILFPSSVPSKNCGLRRTLADDRYVGTISGRQRP
jgi:hypothetical protein